MDINFTDPLYNAAAAQAIGSLCKPTDDPIRAEWNERLGEYLRRRALYDAEDAFGEFRRMHDEHDLLVITLEERFGKAYRTVDAAKAEWGASWDALIAADEKNTLEFLEPLWAAARALTRTPAPDLPAAMLKMRIMKAEETWNDRDLDADAMALVKADMARVAKGG